MQNNSINSIFLGKIKVLKWVKKGKSCRINTLDKNTKHIPTFLIGMAKGKKEKGSRGQEKYVKKVNGTKYITVTSKKEGEQKRKPMSAEIAKRYPTPPTQLETIMNDINETFDILILLLNNRRQALLDEVIALSEEMTARREAKKSKLEELNNTKLNIQRELRHNELKETQGRLIADINQQLKDLDMSYQENSITFECTNEKLEAEIHSFGSFVKWKGIIPHYSNMKQPIITVKRGNQPGEIDASHGIAFCEDSKQIFIADLLAHCIHIFTEDGIFMKRIGEGTLKLPYGVAVYKNSLYVTDTFIDAIIFLYKLPECTLVKSVTSLGLLKGKFEYLSNLTVYKNGDVYIPDYRKNRIVVMDGNLTYKHQLTHTCIREPTDVKIHDDTLFILCSATDQAIQVFSMQGSFLYSVIDRPQITYFCIDITGNIIMSYVKEHNIKVFDRKGALIHVIGKEGHNKGEFYYPRGIAVTNSGKLIIVSGNYNFSLQIFK